MKYFRAWTDFAIQMLIVPHANLRNFLSMHGGPSPTTQFRGCRVGVSEWDAKEKEKKYFLQKYGTAVRLGSHGENDLHTGNNMYGRLNRSELRLRKRP